MQDVIKIFQINFLIGLILIVACCNVTDSEICGESIKIWKSYESFPTQSVFCFQKGGYYAEYYLNTDSTVYRPYFTDVISIPSREGKWSVTNDSFYISEQPFSKNLIHNDTIYLYGRNYFLVDYTPFFEIKVCDCKELEAKLNKKGWAILRTRSQ
jgi:hypothetical protein